MTHVGHPFKRVSVGRRLETCPTLRVGDPSARSWAALRFTGFFGEGRADDAYSRAARDLRDVIVGAPVASVSHPAVPISRRKAGPIEGWIEFLVGDDLVKNRLQRCLVVRGDPLDRDVGEAIDVVWVSERVVPDLLIVPSITVGVPGVEIAVEPGMERVAAVEVCIVKIREDETLGLPTAVKNTAIA